VPLKYSIVLNHRAFGDSPVFVRRSKEGVHLSSVGRIKADLNETVQYIAFGRNFFVTLNTEAGVTMYLTISVHKKGLQKIRSKNCAGTQHL